MNPLKNIFLFFITPLLLLNSFSVKAQQYIPLVVDSTHWFTSPPPPIAPPPYEYGEYYLVGDTTVASINYKKVYYRREWSSNGYGNLTSNFSLVALVREDSLNRKVYGIIYNSTLNPCLLNQEILLYDFNIQIGNNLKSANLCLLLADDSVTSIAQGHWLPSNSFSLYKVGQLHEGVGSDFGLLETMFISVSGPQHRLIDYCRGGLSNCKYLITSVVNETSKNKIAVFPNPLIDYFTINSKKNFELEYQITSINGIIIEKGRSHANTKIPITLGQGIYFVRINSINGKISATQKLIKLH